MSDQETCEWKDDNDIFEGAECWETECGQLHTFINGDPEDNDYAFCPYCGKRLRMAP